MTRIVPNITSIVFMDILIQYIGLTRFSVINRHNHVITICDIEDDFPDIYYPSVYWLSQNMNFGNIS